MRDRLPHPERGVLVPSQARVHRRVAGKHRSLERARRRRTDERLAMRMREGDARARHELITRYLPYARSLALRCRRRGEPTDDLVQVASVGLVRAVDGWDPNLGVALTSYATPTILGELRHYCRDRTWGIRPSRAVQELCLDLRGAQDVLWRELGRSPTVAELARRLDRPPAAILEALLANQDRRLASPGCSGERRGRPGVRERLHRPRDQALDRVEASATLEQLLRVLDEDAREILHLRFNEDLLQREIAERVGCSQMQVSRIIRASLEQLNGECGGVIRDPEQHAAPRAA